MSDLVNGLVALMNGTYSQPVNIGNPEEHSIGTFATIIRDMVGGASEIVNLPPVEDDPQRRRPDITLAKVGRGHLAPEHISPPYLRPS